jgi:hypothetical protein
MQETPDFIGAPAWMKLRTMSPLERYEILRQPESNISNPPPCSPAPLPYEATAFQQIVLTDRYSVPGAMMT